MSANGHELPGMPGGPALPAGVPSFEDGLCSAGLMCAACKTPLVKGWTWKVVTLHSGPQGLQRVVVEHTTCQREECIAVQELSGVAQARREFEWEWLVPIPGSPEAAAAAEAAARPSGIALPDGVDLEPAEGIPGDESDPERHVG